MTTPFLSRSKRPLQALAALLQLSAALGAVALLSGCEDSKPKPAASPDADTTVDTAEEGSAADSGEGSDASAGEDADAASDSSEPPSACDAQIEQLASTDCGCGGQLVCRGQAEQPICVGALRENACGGCGSFAAEIGASCGFCGDGVWTCDEANPDAPTCVGATPQNSCGGCTALPGNEGDLCGADGFFLCVTEEELVCVGPGQNACGGFAALGEAVGGPCGECGAGRFVCDGADAVRCEEAASPRNGCGGCGTLPNRVGDDCGDCGGTWACDPSNEDGLVCSQTRNVCGSCGSPGAGALGEACTGGRLVCGTDGQLACESSDRNLCGGTATLEEEPGSACGACGGFNICASPDRVACIGAMPANACGGCGFLPGFPGGFCGVDHTWECNADGTMTCQQTSSSVVVSDAVGGRTAVENGQVSIPAGAVGGPIRITITVRTGLSISGYELTSPVLEFGPAGTEFATPIEVQIISDDAPASSMVWSNRPSDGGGYSEVAGATVVGDALVGEVSHFSVGFTGFPIPNAEICGDGLDNDGDGAFDCEDREDCGSDVFCVELDCANGLDDDFDGFIDCDDESCAPDSACGELFGEVCDDGVDNDGDGLADCDDLDCAGAGCSSRTERCDNSIDDDLDGFTDCEDSECVGALICDSAGVEVCGDGRDNDGDELADCYDYDCSVAVIGGSCPEAVGSPNWCPSGTRYQREVIAVGERWGLCLPVVGAGESCGADSICDETQNLVCGAAGTCRLAVQAEACDGAVPLTPNPGSAGPDYYAVDRLDGLIAADESLNCTGTVGPEKVYFYTATSPVEITIAAGATDSNGPAISWHARIATCGDIFSEVACSSASLEATSGSVQLTAGQTLYIIVDSAARWAGGDAGAAEFFLEVNERPVAILGESCAAAACESGTTCASSDFCVVTVCGDGELGGTEACDDGNAVAGDGCTACAVDVYHEVEPNDPVANSVGNARIITGSSASDIDRFCVSVGANGGQVELSLASATGGELYWAPYDSFTPTLLTVDQPVILTTTSSNLCFAVASFGSVSYTLRVNPAISIPEHGACGEQSGVVGDCADIGGTPAICRLPELLRRVGTCERSACGDGFVNGAAGESCDDGNVAAGDGCSATCLLETYAEIEPNNGTLTARNIGSFRAVSGDISAATDADYFKFTLARRSHLEFAADSALFTRGSYGLSIQLLSSTGAEIFSRAIDSFYGVSGARTGGPADGSEDLYPLPELAFLEPGTYTFRVSSSSATGAYTVFVREFGASVVPEGGACDPTAYLPCSGALACSLLTETCEAAVCGNGDVTVGEDCDDGNTTDGDGCSGSCVVEVRSSELLSFNPSLPGAALVGARFSFVDGSQGSIYGLDFGSCGDGCGVAYYVSLHIDGASRVRTYNVGSKNRIWRMGSPSPYSTLGVQVSNDTTTSHLPPRWLAAAPSQQAQTCYGNTGDGVCSGVEDGLDCYDCGIRYGSLPISEDGIDTHLAPGDYLMEVSPRYGGIGWIVVGESPLE